MKIHRLLISGVLAGFVVNSSPLSRPVAAQSGTGGAHTVWDTDLMQVYRVSLAPGERITHESAGGSVIVYLSADLDGRMPPTEAAWRDPGSITMENHGRGRFEALVVDLKSRITHAGVTAPEVARALNTAGYEQGYGVTIRSQNLIVNDHISVVWERYAPGGYAVDPVHFHPHDAVVVYLRSGYIWPSSGFLGPDRVARGDVQIISGDALHTGSNAGSDPLDFLLIIPG
jgi:quercetin dioxygenase-like cupin family protein